MPTELASVALRELGPIALAITEQVQAKPSASCPGASELSALRSTEGGGGRARAALLDQLGGDLPVMMGNLVLMIEGVADCLQAAESRDNLVNIPALSATVRPALEIAAQISWLFDDSIDGPARARRYLIWRFNDLRHQRSILSDFRLKKEDLEAATQELDGIETELLETVRLAKWVARPTVIHANGNVEGAALLDGEKAERMPKMTELIGMVSSTPSLYGLLSVPTHGLRFGAFIGLVADNPKPDSSGRLEAKMSGFGVPPNLVIGLACLALVTAVNKFAGWYAVDASKLHQLARRLLNSAGFAN